MSLIASAIENLGGDVIPRLQYTSPSDSNWLMTQRGGASSYGPASCSTVGDVIQLLKASERCAREYTCPDVGQFNCSRCATVSSAVRANCDWLVLRKTNRLHPSSEFRCFVLHGVLCGISQRHPDHFAPHLITSSPLICSKLNAWWVAHQAQLFNVLFAPGACICQFNCQCWLHSNWNCSLSDYQLHSICILIAKIKLISSTSVHSILFQLANCSAVKTSWINTILSFHNPSWSARDRVRIQSALQSPISSLLTLSCSKLRN